MTEHITGLYEYLLMYIIELDIVRYGYTFRPKIELRNYAVK